jgi:hypothetical protein
VDIILTSEIETRSIGVVHRGVLRVARRDAGFAFNLESQVVNRIPKALGLFMDAEGEGPTALIMSLAGGSLLDRKDPVPLLVK